MRRENDIKPMVEEAWPCEISEGDTPCSSVIMLLGGSRRGRYQC